MDNTKIGMKRKDDSPKDEVSRNIADTSTKDDAFF